MIVSHLLPRPVEGRRHRDEAEESIAADQSLAVQQEDEQEEQDAD